MSYVASTSVRRRYDIMCLLNSWKGFTYTYQNTGVIAVTPLCTNGGKHVYTQFLKTNIHTMHGSLMIRLVPVLNVILEQELSTHKTEL